MADPKLTEWTDAELGRLTWDDDDNVWVGRTSFAGREVRITIDPDRKQPTRQERLAAIEPARALLARVKAGESDLRRQASEQIGEAVGAPEPDIERLAKTLVLETIGLHGSGELYYRNEEFFPGELITVHFDEDLSNVEAAIYEA
jgi:hypothetical protein